jgi:hypothetical protein
VVRGIQRTGKVEEGEGKERGKKKEVKKKEKKRKREMHPTPSYQIYA